jgi:hypothetical protein
MSWGKSRHTKIPMGVKVAVDIFQEVMTKIFTGLDFICVYLDDVFVLSNGSLEDHMYKARLVVERLQTAEYKIYVRKLIIVSSLDNG